MIDVFIGYDPREAVAYHVCAQSIIARASEPVRIVPLALNTLKGYKEAHTDGSNAFIYSRFLVPWLMGFRGYAIFIDGDMILRHDIAGLWNLRGKLQAVQVVKHDYKTKYPVKYLGAKNEDYPRKNWSSVILWNCSDPRNACLTPDFISKHDGAFLHRFSWLKDDAIGDLPPFWNHLTMEQEPTAASLLHFTVGTPCFPGYEHQEGGDEWWAEYRNAITPVEEAREGRISACGAEPDAGEHHAPVGEKAHA